MSFLQNNVYYDNSQQSDWINANHQMSLLEIILASSEVFHFYSVDKGNMVWQHLPWILPSFMLSSHFLLSNIQSSYLCYFHRVGLLDNDKVIRDRITVNRKYWRGNGVDYVIGVSILVILSLVDRKSCIINSPFYHCLWLFE